MTVTHPTWCSPAKCRSGQDGSTSSGEHQSEPRDIDLHLMHVGYGLASTTGHGTAYLTQAICPWPTEVYLHVTAGDHVISQPLHAAAGLLAQLNNLVAEAGR